MKDADTKHRFIELRAAGRSYSDIATELQVSKQTLINWKKEFQLEIDNLKAVEIDAIQRRYTMHRQGRIELLGKMLDGLKAELAKRNLGDLPTDRLITHILKVGAAIAREEPDLKFSGRDERSITAQLVDELNTTIDTWSA